MTGRKATRRHRQGGGQTLGRQEARHSHQPDNREGSPDPATVRRGQAHRRHRPAGRPQPKVGVQGPGADEEGRLSRPAWGTRPRADGFSADRVEELIIPKLG